MEINIFLFLQFKHARKNIEKVWVEARDLTLGRKKTSMTYWAKTTNKDISRWIWYATGKICAYYKYILSSKKEIFLKIVLKWYYYIKPL